MFICHVVGVVLDNLFINNCGIISVEYRSIYPPTYNGMYDDEKVFTCFYYGITDNVVIQNDSVIMGFVFVETFCAPINWNVQYG